LTVFYLCFIFESLNDNLDYCLTYSWADVPQDNFTSDIFAAANNEDTV